MGVGCGLLHQHVVRFYWTLNRHSSAKVESVYVLQQPEEERVQVKTANACVTSCAFVILKDRLASVLGLLRVGVCNLIRNN